MAKTQGKYFPDVAAGNVFIASTTAAGVAIPISTGTAATVGLWNTSTTKNAVPLYATLGVTSGTIALGVFGLAQQYCGFNIATGAPCSAVTAVAPKNALLNSGKSTAMTSFSATATVTGGSAALWFGKSIESATVGLGIFDGRFDFDGSLIVPPGTMVFLCSSVAQTAIMSCSFAWAEVDI